MSSAEMEEFRQDMLAEQAREMEDGKLDVKLKDDYEFFVEHAVSETDIEPVLKSLKILCARSDQDFNEVLESIVDGIN